MEFQNCANVIEEGIWGAHIPNPHFNIHLRLVPLPNTCLQRVILPLLSLTPAPTLTSPYCHCNHYDHSPNVAATISTITISPTNPINNFWVRRSLALWKRQYISKGGRITLIKSTLASMPIYQMSIFKMPKIVARRLEKVQRDFLWGGGNLEGKIHLVNWEVVCTDKDKGGLGLRKLAMLNKALLGKWIWRYACDKDSLWRQVIKVKYGQEGLDWRPKKIGRASCRERV